MHEPDIAPLARRLAEENNVDWRRLSGTGDGGRVVERDVLGYLARVMAGEEAVDPTPEPVPEGMEAWPAEDVGGYGGRDVDDDPASPPTLDDDLFLFDDPAPPAPADADDALFVATDDAGAVDAAAPGAAGDADDDADGTLIDASGTGDGEAEGEEGVWLVGDDAVDAGDAAAPPPAEPAPADADEVFELGAAEAAGAEMRIDELPDLTVGENEADLYADDDEKARAAGGRGALDLPDLFADADDAHDEHVSGHVDLALDDDGAVDGLGVEAPGEHAPAASEAAGGVGPETVPAAADADGGVAAAVAPASLQPEPTVTLVRHGQLWRRRFDDRPLRQVASDAAAVLDVSPSSMVVVLMARAALRAGVADGAVDAWRWRRDGAERRAIDAEAAVREAARQVEARAAANDGAQPADPPRAGLVVADLGDLGVDEAVLHLDAPVLALGRSSADGAWLSLSGDELDGHAASGLARVAELLGTPVRLLL